MYTIYGNVTGVKILHKADIRTMSPICFTWAYVVHILCIFMSYWSNIYILYFWFSYICSAMYLEPGMCHEYSHIHGICEAYSIHMLWLTQFYVVRFQSISCLQAACTGGQWQLQHTWPSWWCWFWVAQWKHVGGSLHGWFGQGSWQWL